MIYLKLFAILITSSYVALLMYFINGWSRGKKYFSLQKQFYTFTSIIIPARNEEENIDTVIGDIDAQDFPENLFEIIVADDHSEDNTLQKVILIQKTVGNLRIVENDKKFIGKKMAISAAIKESRGELIITVDADCRMGKNWLSSMVSFYEEKKPEMIIAPVVFHNEKSLFEKIQSLEFLSLAGITGASAMLGKPLMCNGANLAYRKNSFYEVNGFEGNEKTPSGDDVLLLMKFKKKYPGKINYLKSAEAVVFTNPQKNIPGFISQRKRWVSKNSFYNDFFVTMVSWLTLIFNFSILAFAALSILNKGFAEILLISLVSKTFIDFLFLLLTASFFGRKTLLWLYLPVQLLYLFYVPLIALSGFGGKFTWKGRKY